MSTFSPATASQRRGLEERHGSQPASLLRALGRPARIRRALARRRQPPCRAGRLAEKPASLAGGPMPLPGRAALSPYAANGRLTACRLALKRRPERPRLRTKRVLRTAPLHRRIPFALRSFGGSWFSFGCGPSPVLRRPPFPPAKLWGYWCLFASAPSASASARNMGFSIMGCTQQ